MLIRAFKEPLLQFFVAGAIIFGLYSLTGGEEIGPTPEIRITLAEQGNLAALYRKTWQREPNSEELSALIDRRVGEELLYREALALGLDKDDVIIRRRLSQKIEFIADDLAARRDPSDEELAAFLEANAENYRRDATYTFQQVFLSADLRGGDMAERAAAALAELKDGADPGTLGDASLLPREMEMITALLIARTFGADFTDGLQRIAVGGWQGPVRSAYGAHLVRIAHKEDGRPLTLKEARGVLERDWRLDQREKARLAYRKSIEGKYRIVIETAE